MNIKFLHIRNFRKLKDCRIDISPTQTLFVGANNSGKTSAMDSLMLFLKLKKGFSTRDFTLSNWKDINRIGDEWIKVTDSEKIDLSVQLWEDSIPSLDLWLNVNQNELHYIHHLIPTLDWTGGILGIRLRFEPENPEILYKGFVEAFNAARVLEKPTSKTDSFKIWPINLWDFLDEKSNLKAYFKIRTYLLNPQQHEISQKLSPANLPLDGDPLDGLIKVDIINAQRGFTDVNSETGEPNTGSKNLSSQLRSYYDKHLNPSVNPTEKDIKALRAISEAKRIFDDNLKMHFEISLKELETLNYPGFGNPQINLSSKFNTLDGLNHDSAVQYSLEDGLALPEKHNGLGYQNLISMIFKLIRFRDEWMQVGKSYKSKPTDQTNSDFEPLHLVLIEEPEAHLHAQVQQVFIKKAYEVLRGHLNLKETKFETQLIISTHSNHIAHETDFISLRYFKRGTPVGKSLITSTVVNLSKTFGTDDETTRFAIRYLKTTHCDLFFADAVILVEGPAERMLVPYFIKKHKLLDNCYISILEIGGSHAHRLQPLIESLGLITLIITDLDALYGKSKIQPARGKGYTTGNDTLKSWFPVVSDLDCLLSLKFEEKEKKDLPIRVAYQTSIKLQQKDKAVEVHPYTFEDSLVMTNRNIFRELPKDKGLLAKMIEGSKEDDIACSARKLYDAITDSAAKKAEFALELFFFREPRILETPHYIEEGLSWLQEKLIPQKTVVSKLKKIGHAQ